MKKLSSIIWGIVLIAAGLAFGLNALGVTNIDVFFDGWWTLFIIIPCGIGLITERDKTGNLIGFLIGVCLLLSAQDILDFSVIWKLVLPIIIIVIGIKMIAGGLFGGKSHKVQKEIEASGLSCHSSFAAFTGTKVNFDGQSFFGAELNAVFGGIDYDLCNAIISQDCVIHATAIFGAIDIHLPENVNVKITSNSIFGGVACKRSNAHIEGAVTVYINGSGIFGRVDVK